MESLASQYASMRKLRRTDFGPVTLHFEHREPGRKTGLLNFAEAEARHNLVSERSKTLRHPIFGDRLLERRAADIGVVMARGNVLHHPAVEVEEHRLGPGLPPGSELDSASIEPGALDLDLDALFRRMGDPHRTTLILLEIRYLTREEGAYALGHGAVEMAQLDSVHRAGWYWLFCRPLGLLGL